MRVYLLVDMMGDLLVVWMAGYLVVDWADDSADDLVGRSVACLVYLMECS